MSGGRPAGGITGVAVALAVCCGLHAVLLLVGGITLVGLSLRSWTLAFAGLIVLTLGVVWFRHYWCSVPARDRTEGDGDAHPGRAG